MAIRINLLAEAQALEEERRKDPVKRGVLAGVFLVLLVLLWSSSLQVKLVSAKSTLSGLEARWKSIEKGYQQAVQSQGQALEAERKLAALHQLTTNRFLWGTALNAFQQTLNGVDDLQVVRLKTEQTYSITEETKGKTPKPATATEKIGLTIEALDSSSSPGGHVSKFKDSIAQLAFFRASLAQTNGVLLTSLSAPQVGAGRNPFVLFTLHCTFPEKVR
jgi:hypothetical protein